MAKTQLEARSPKPAARGWILPAILLLFGCSSAEPAPEAMGPLRMALFASDVTPPLGHPLCGGWIKPAAAIGQPLVLKGVVLDDGRTRCVIAAMDWCVLSGAAFDLFRGKMAAAAGVPITQVAIQTTHTH